MITIGDFRKAIESVLHYALINEEDDFIEQMEGFESGDDTMPSQHILMDILTVANGLREADGEPPYTLGTFINQERETYFLCTNPQCGYVGTDSDPLLESQMLQLDVNEPVPAGGCPYCGGIVRGI